MIYFLLNFHVFLHFLYFKFIKYIFSLLFIISSILFTSKDEKSKNNTSFSDYKNYNFPKLSCIDNIWLNFSVSNKTFDKALLVFYLNLKNLSAIFLFFCER